MSEPNRTSSNGRSSHGGSQIRPEVAMAAAMITAFAIGIGVFSFRGMDDRSRSTVAVVHPEPSPAAAAPSASQPTPAIEPLALPPSRPLQRKESAADRRQSVRASVAAIPASQREPEWDGTGMPSREWLRWQLKVLVEQMHPQQSISENALESAVDDALDLREAKLQMESAKDPSALVEAQERFERASKDLAANIGIEGIDVSAF